MSPQSKNTSATLIPCLRYRDVAAAIDWLCRAFGFECRRLYKDELIGITHAQLAFGNGMVMVAPVVDSEYGRQLRQPDEIGGASTQGIYVIVNSADALYAQAKAAGAQIAIELKDEDYATTRKGICGASAPTIPGRMKPPVPSPRPEQTVPTIGGNVRLVVAVS